MPMIAMQTISGDERARLLALLTRLAYEKRKVVLSSGRESDFYIDTKQASLSAEGHYLVGRLALAEIRARYPNAQAVGGLTMMRSGITIPVFPSAPFGRCALRHWQRSNTVVL